MQRLIGLFISLICLLPVQLSSQAQTDCELSPRLISNSIARVTPGEPNNMRDAPTTSANLIGTIPSRATFAVLDGPVCMDGFYWWYVNYDGLIGWTVEGSADTYWLEPYQLLCETLVWHGQPATANTEIIVYTSPSLDSEQITALQRGDLLEVGTQVICPLADGARPFVSVIVDSQIGWIESTRWNGSEQYSVDVAVVDANPRPLPVVVDAQARLQNSIVQLPSLPQDSITAENVSQLQLMQTIGDGYITDFAWSADSKELFISTTLDVRLYPADNLNAAPQIFDGHDAAITKMALSPDMDTLITGDNSGRLNIQNVRFGEIIHTVELDERVSEIAFRPDGRWFSVLTTSTSEITLHSYRWADNGIDRAYSTSIKGVTRITGFAFTPDSRYQLLLQGRSIWVWDMQQGSDQPTRTESSSGVIDDILAWSLDPSGTRIALLTEQVCCDPSALNYAYIVRIYDIASGEIISGLEIETSGVRRSALMQLAYTPQGSLWWREGNQLTQLYLDVPAHSSSLDAITQSSLINPNGTIAAIAGDSGEIRLFDLTNRDATPDVYNVLYGVVGNVNQQAFSPDGTRIAARGSDNTLRMWELDSGQRQGTIRLNAVQSPVAIVSNRLYSGSSLWDIGNGQLLETRSGTPSGPVFERQTTTDGRVLSATQSTTEQGVIWDAVTGEVVYQLEIFIGRAEIAFSRDGQYLAYNLNNRAFVVDTASGETLARLSPQYGYLYHLAFSTDNRLLMMYEFPSLSGGKPTLLVRDIASGDLLVNIPFQSLVDRTVIWSPDGASFSWIELTFDEDSNSSYEYRVYDVLTQSTTAWQFDNSTPALQDMFRLVAGGELLIVGMIDGSLQFYDPASGDMLHKISSMDTKITDIQFDETGNKLVIVGEDGIARLWTIVNE